MVTNAVEQDMEPVVGDTTMYPGPRSSLEFLEFLQTQKIDLFRHKNAQIEIHYLQKN